MDRDLTPLPKPLKGLYSLVLVTVVGITSCSVALLFYKFLLARYRRWRLQNTAQPIYTVGVIPTNEIDRLKGIEQKLLDSIPIIMYSLKNRSAFCLDQTECAVFLGELEEVDMVRVLPGCKHSFHVPCIDQWLKQHVSCPLCRTPLGASGIHIVIEWSAEISQRNDVTDEDGVSPLRTGTSCFYDGTLCFDGIRERTEQWVLQANLNRSVSTNSLFFIKDTERSSIL